MQRNATLLNHMQQNAFSNNDLFFSHKTQLKYNKFKMPIQSKQETLTVDIHSKTSLTNIEASEAGLLNKSSNLAAPLLRCD
jgi:hypothetical protein